MLISILWILFYAVAFGLGAFLVLWILRAYLVPNLPGQLDRGVYGLIAIWAIINILTVIFYGHPLLWAHPVGMALL